jgi:hypothetical protein
MSYLFVQSTAPLKDTLCHPRVSRVLAQHSCRLIHHQWSVDKVDTMSPGFFVGETPTYKLASTFENELHSLLIEKSKNKVAKLPQFRIALTPVRAHVPHADNPEIPIPEACTAFELQVPVHHHKVMEEIISRVFDHPKATQLKFL